MCRDVSGNVESGDLRLAMNSVNGRMCSFWTVYSWECACILLLMVFRFLPGFPYIWNCVHCPAHHRRNARCRCCATICSKGTLWSKPTERRIGREDARNVFPLIPENLLRTDRGRGAGDHNTKQWNNKHKFGISSTQGSVEGKIPFLKFGTASYCTLY